MRRLVLLPVLAVALACSACSGTGITAERVDAAVGPAFSRLVDLQQRELGHPGARHADPTAQCSRNRGSATTSPAVVATPDPNNPGPNNSDPNNPGPNNPDTSRGAGDDWLCVLNFPYPDGHIEPVSYDVRVQPTGCYTAQGPSQVVGRQQQRTAGGALVTNPLFEFDGCFALG